MTSEEESPNIIQLSFDLIEEYEKNPSSSLITDYLVNNLNKGNIDRQVLPDFIEGTKKIIFYFLCVLSTKNIFITK